MYGTASKVLLSMLIMLTLGSCSSLTGFFNPLKTGPDIDVTAQVGKNNKRESRTQLVEAKSTATTTNDNKAKVINQDYTNVEPWMVILVALGFGLALPSPVAWYSHSRETKFLKQQIEILQRNTHDIQREVTRRYKVPQGGLHKEGQAKEV